MNVCLTEMTTELARRYFKGFTADPALYTDSQIYRPYTYDQAKVDERVNRYRSLGHKYFAIMLDSEPIGDIVLKNIDHELRCCQLGISLQSDTYKNKGYGTEAETLALHFAFHELKLNTVFADALLNNTRSQHVLKKVGFREMNRDDTFVYYRCDRADWLDKYGLPGFDSASDDSIA